MTVATGHPYGPTSATTLAGSTIPDELPAYRNALQAQNKSPATVSLWVGAIRQLHAYLQEQGMPTDVAAIRREHLEQWLASLLATGSKASTVNNRYRSVQPFFAYLLRDNVIRESPMRNMRPPAIPDNDVAVPKGEHARRLLDHTAKDKSFEGYRDVAILRLLASAGLRRAELAGIRVGDVDWDNQDVQVLGKGRKHRKVALLKKTYDAMNRYRRNRNKHHQAHRPEFWVGRRGPLTGWGIHQMLEARCDAAGVPRIYPHQLRHYWAHVNADRLTPEELRRQAGWSKNSRMDQRYAASTAAERSLAAAKAKGYED